MCCPQNEQFLQINPYSRRLSPVKCALYVAEKALVALFLGFCEALERERGLARGIISRANRYASYWNTGNPGDFVQCGNPCRKPAHNIHLIAAHNIHLLLTHTIYVVRDLRRFWIKLYLSSFENSPPRESEIRSNINKNSFSLSSIVSDMNCFSSLGVTVSLMNQFSM